MTLKALIPAPVEVGREALIMLGGALLAAFVIGQLPAVRSWMRDQWGVAPQPIPLTH